MRMGLFMTALLASTLFSGTALADQYGDDAGQKQNRGQSIKERVLEKQREGFAKASREKATDRSRQLKQPERHKPAGDIYGDQATRSGGKTRASQAAGKNMSASNTVNTPREIKAMVSRINPMFGAYRTSQAAEGADSYGGRSNVPNGKVEGQRNMSASGAVNTPAEIKQMLRSINPFHGAYRMAAGDGADSYGGGDFSYEKLKRNGAIGGTSAVDHKAVQRKNELARERIERAVKSKMDKAK